MQCCLIGLNSVNMRRLLFFFSFICVMLVNASAQRISFQDLVSFLHVKSWKDVNAVLKRRGWDLDAVDEKIPGDGSIMWAYGKADMMSQAEELLTLDRWDGEISSVEIEVRKKSRYNSILSSALSSGFREYGSWDGIFKQYIKKKMTLYVNSREDKETKKYYLQILTQY